MRNGRGEQLHGRPWVSLIATSCSKHSTAAVRRSPLFVSLQVYVMLCLLFGTSRSSVDARGVRAATVECRPASGRVGMWTGGGGPRAAGRLGRVLSAQVLTCLTERATVCCYVYRCLRAKLLNRVFLFQLYFSENRNHDHPGKPQPRSSPASGSRENDIQASPKDFESTCEPAFADSRDNGQACMAWRSSSPVGMSHVYNIAAHVVCPCGLPLSLNH